MWIEVERRAGGGREDDDPDRGRREDDTPQAGHLPSADGPDPDGSDPDGSDPDGPDPDGSDPDGPDPDRADGDRPEVDADRPDADRPDGADDHDGATAGAAPGGARKRSTGGDLRAAGWAVAAIVVATLSIFMVQRLYASDSGPSTSGPRGAERPRPTAGHTGRSPSGPPGCTASFAVGSAWQTGFQATVTVRATGAAVIDGWTVTWTFPGEQTVLQMWNGHYTQTRSKVTVRSEGWNGSPSPKGSTAFGFVGSGTAPAGVQGLTCTVSIAVPSPSRT